MARRRMARATRVSDDAHLPPAASLSPRPSRFSLSWKYLSSLWVPRYVQLTCLLRILLRYCIDVALAMSTLSLQLGQRVMAVVHRASVTDSLLRDIHSGYGDRACLLIYQQIIANSHGLGLHCRPRRNGSLPTWTVCDLPVYQDECGIEWVPKLISYGACCCPAVDSTPGKHLHIIDPVTPSPTTLPYHRRGHCRYISYFCSPCTR